MAQLEPKIFTALSTFTAVTALVSKRVYPMVIPQKAALPCVTYFRVSGGQVNNLGGYTGNESPRIQIDCWAETYAQAKSLASAVRAAMFAASAFTAVILTDRDMYEDDQHIYRVSIDFSCWHKEA